MSSSGRKLCSKFADDLLDAQEREYFADLNQLSCRRKVLLRCLWTMLITSHTNKQEATRYSNIQEVLRAFADMGRSSGPNRRYEPVGRRSAEACRKYSYVLETGNTGLRRKKTVLGEIVRNGMQKIACPVRVNAGLWVGPSQALASLKVTCCRFLFDTRMKHYRLKKAQTRKRPFINLPVKSLKQISIAQSFS